MAISFGTPDGDTLLGIDDPDMLFGLGGDDRLDALGTFGAVLGGPGDDTLQGGYGIDTVRGGAGHDLFLFGREGIVSQDTADGVGEGNRDVVLDFHRGRNVLDLSGYRGISLPLGTPGPEFIGTDPFLVDEHRPQVRHDVQGGNTIIQIFSPFGTPPDDVPTPPAQATVEIELRGVHGISEDDLILG